MLLVRKERDQITPLNKYIYIYRLLVHLVHFMTNKAAHTRAERDGMYRCCAIRPHARRDAKGGEKAKQMDMDREAFCSPIPTLVGFL